MQNAETRDDLRNRLLTASLRPRHETPIGMSQQFIRSEFINFIADSLWELEEKIAELENTTHACPNCNGVLDLDAKNETTKPASATKPKP